MSRNELVTEIKELQAENKLLKEENSRIWDNIKILIAKISHEMKTPLNSIIGFSELFLNRTKNEKLKGYANNISFATNHLLSLINNLVDITRAQYKPIELSFSIFNPKDIIIEIINNFPKSDIEYTVIDINICADYTRFKQLIYNLISNALKYNHGNIPVNIITYLDGDMFCFEISDHGEGIEETDYDKIFEFFTQVSQDINKRQIGSGIGLALCKTIVEAHRGKIKVTSTVGKGSTFSFKIPLSADI